MRPTTRDRTTVSSTFMRVYSVKCFNTNREDDKSMCDSVEMRLVKISNLLLGWRTIQGLKTPYARFKNIILISFMSIAMAKSVTAKRDTQ